MISITLPNHLACLHDALLLVDTAPVECDGHTLMVSVALTKARIRHERIVGSVIGKDSKFSLAPHFWINIDGYLLDYRLRMWVSAFNGPEMAQCAPHGIFPENSDTHCYKYMISDTRPVADMSSATLNFMTDGFAGKLAIPTQTIAYYNDEHNMTLSH